MKRILTLLFAAALAPGVSRGQVEVACRAAHLRVVYGEPVRVTLDVVNNTGGQMVFSGPDANAALRFDVEQSPDALVPESGEPLLDEPAVIEPGKKLTREIDLLSKYAIRVSGPYTITARVEWGDKIFISPKVFVDVVPGLEIRRLTVGVPALGGAVRVFSLRVLSRNRGESVFLRVDDEASGECLGVADLGPIVRLNEPTIQADEAGGIHVVHQCGPDRFAHNVFDAEGRLAGETRYSSTSGGPAAPAAGEEPGGTAPAAAGHSTIPPPDLSVLESVPAQ